VRFEPTKKSESRPPTSKTVATSKAVASAASVAPNGSASGAKTALAPSFSAFEAEELQALFAALEAIEPQDYTCIADNAGSGFGIDGVCRNFGKVPLAPQTIRVGGRRTSVRLEPEFWMAISYVVSAAKIDQGKFFLDIERRSGRYAFASKIRSAVVSALLKMALAERARIARHAAGSRNEPAPGNPKTKKPVTADAIRKRANRIRSRR